jgi:hypothetical protein
VWVIHACFVGVHSSSEHQTGIIARLSYHLGDSSWYTYPENVSQVRSSRLQFIPCNVNHSAFGTLSNRHQRYPKAYADLIKANLCNIYITRFSNICSLVSGEERDGEYPLIAGSGWRVSGQWVLSFVLPLKTHVRFVHPFSIDAVLAVVFLCFCFFAPAVTMVNTRLANGGRSPALSLSRILCIWATWVSVAATLPQAGMRLTTVFHTVASIFPHTDLNL